MPRELPADLGRSVKTADLTNRQTRLLRSLVSGWIKALERNLQGPPPGTEPERFKMMCRMIDGGYAEVLYRSDGSYGFNTSKDALKRFALNDALAIASAVRQPDPFADRGPWYANFVVEVLRSPNSHTRAPDGEAGLIRPEDIERAEKYVVRPDVMPLADDLVPARFPLIIPADLAWAEWIVFDPAHPQSMYYIGVLISDLGAGRLTGHIMVGPTSDPSISIIRFSYDNGTVDIHAQNDLALAGAAREILHTAAAVFELIRHPRAVHKERRDPTSKLVRSRGRLVREHTAAFTDVKIHVTYDEEEAEPGDRQPHEPGASGIKKRFHHVRPFARVVLGRPQLVVGHWRGDPRLGVCVPRSYQVVP